MRYRGVVFDMDGLMFDTERLTFELQREILKAHGYDWTLELYKQTVGLRTEDLIPFFRKFGGEDFDIGAFRGECRKAYREYTDKFGVPVKDGLFELLELLKREEIKIALATSTTEQSAVRTLKIAGVLDYFDALVCAGDVENGKPAPDPFLKAAEKLGLEPADCAALEDSLNGIRSAHAAGMAAIMIPDLIAPTDEIRGMCEAVLNSLRDVEKAIR